MKTIVGVICILFLVTFFNANQEIPDPNLQFITSQLSILVKEVKDRVSGNDENKKIPGDKNEIEPLTSPRSIRNGKLFLTPSRDWCSGFFPGSLWLVYELTGDQ